MPTIEIRTRIPGNIARTPKYVRAAARSGTSSCLYCLAARRATFAQPLLERVLDAAARDAEKEVRTYFPDHPEAISLSAEGYPHSDAA